MEGVDIHLYQPTPTYQNVAKRRGVQKLTPARALVAELVRRYCALGVECSLLEIQKLTYFLDRTIKRFKLDDPLRLAFVAQRYGPYADRLRHLLDALDGSYLHSDKRISDATRRDTIWFDDKQRERVAAYLTSEAKGYLGALEETSNLIEGFESPLGMELLATVDWLLVRQGCEATLESVRVALGRWPDGGHRKQKIFTDRMLGVALERLAAAGW